MKTVQVTIKGTAPLLIHRFTEESSQQKASRKITIQERDPREEATKVAYIAPDGTYYFNAMAIPGCIGNAGSNHKMKGSRKSLRYVVPSAVRMNVEAVTILNGDGKPAKDFEVDSRPVTIPATKGKIMRHRPRFDNWSAKFELVVNENILGGTDIVHQLLNEAGESIGIGDFRPEKRGPFGTFLVTEFVEMKK